MTIDEAANELREILKDEPWLRSVKVVESGGVKMVAVYVTSLKDADFRAIAKCRSRKAPTIVEAQPLGEAE